MEILRAGDARHSGSCGDGIKDIEAGQAVVVRRDTREKITVAIDELAAELPKILDSMQKDMLERARKHRDAHTYVAHNMEELKDIADNKPGFIKAMWCGERECEDKLKEDAGITSRCMPFEQETISDVCVCCGKPAKKMVYWGKSILKNTERRSRSAKKGCKYSL